MARTDDVPLDITLAILALGGTPNRPAHWRKLSMLSRPIKAGMTETEAIHYLWRAAQRTMASLLGLAMALRLLLAAAVPSEPVPDRRPDAAAPEPTDPLRLRPIAPNAPGAPRVRVGVSTPAP